MPVYKHKLKETFTNIVKMVYTEKDYFTTKFASEILHDVVHEQNLIEPEYEVSKGNGKGFGFLSFIIRIRVKGKNAEKSFIIKVAQQNEQIRKLFSVRSFFLQEIKYYQAIFPAFKKFQTERNIKYPFKAHPKCYKTMNTEFNELLVFENLDNTGFEIFEISKQMNDAHVELVLREYGKFHAVSLAMKDQDIELFNSLTKDVINPYSSDNINNEIFDLYKIGIDVIKSTLNPLDESKIIDALNNISENVIGVFKTLDSYDGKAKIIIHGDCWRNNMMFKYQGEDPEKPIDVRFFDYQLGKLSTPVVDLSYFLYSTLSAEMLKNLDHYLNIYYDSLRFHVHEMGSHVEKFYPFTTLTEEWKIYCKFGVMASVVVYKVTLRAKDEAAALIDVPEDTKISLVDIFLKKSRNDNLINQKCRSLALHLYENGFI